MMMTVGRVRFDDLVVHEDEELLGEGTFGMVLPGTYFGQDVAIKKARDFRGSARIKDLFRCAREQRIIYRSVLVCLSHILQLGAEARAAVGPFI